MKKRCVAMLKLIVLAKALILIVGCATNTAVDSYCATFVPIYEYFYLEDSDPSLFNEIHKNMKRFEHRCDT
jgi:hypothetical protein